MSREELAGLEISAVDGAYAAIAGLGDEVAAAGMRIAALERQAEKMRQTIEGAGMLLGGLVQYLLKQAK